MNTTSNNDQFSCALDDILHPGSRYLFRHWESVRGEQSAPLKSDIDLKHLKDHLPHIGILQRHALKSSYRWRLAGTAICRLFGSEVTNAEFMADWHEFERKTIAQALDSTVGGHQPCVARLKAQNKYGDIVGLELLALPVITKQAHVTHLLVGLSQFRELDKIHPRALTDFELSRLKMIWTEHAKAKVHSVLAHDPHAIQTGAPERPVFRVIEGGLNE